MIRRALGVSRAFISMGWQVSVTYPLSFALDQVVTLVPVVTYYFVAQLIEDQPATGGDYFAFVVIGIIATRLLSAGLRGVADSIEEAIKEGQFEALLTQPVSWTILPFGLVQWPMLWRCVNALGVAALAVLLGAHFRLAGVPGAIVIVVLGAGATVAIGVLAAAVKLLARRTDPIITVYSIAAQLLSGVFYPIDVLPAPLQTLSRLLPDTYAIAAMRRLLMPDSASLTGPSVNEALVVLIGFNIVLFPIAIWAFRRSLDFGRRMGVLGGY